MRLSPPQATINAILAAVAAVEFTPTAVHNVGVLEETLTAGVRSAIGSEPGAVKVPTLHRTGALRDAAWTGASRPGP